MLHLEGIRRTLGALDTRGSERRAETRKTQCPRAIEFPGVGVGARSSDEAPNGMATEVWQSLGGSTETALCSSEQTAPDLPVVDLDDAASEALIPVASSRGCVAARDREQNFALAASGLSERERACQKRVPRGPCGEVGSAPVGQCLDLTGSPSHHAPSLELFNVPSIAASRLRIASRVISPTGRCVVFLANS